MMAGFPFTQGAQTVLKVYDKESDIPEVLKGEYIQQGSKWVPHLSDDHPAVVFNKTLKAEKEVEEAKVKNLRNDLDEALKASKSSDLPRGHVAVPKADAELLNEIKSLGDIPAIKTKLTEYDSLKAANEKTTRENNLRTVAKDLGYSNVEAFVRLPALQGVEFASTEKDGKKTWTAKVKDGDKIVERPATEFIDSNADIAPFLPALKATEGVSVHGSASGEGANPDRFAALREIGKQINESKAPAQSLSERFGLAKSA
jgi:hypothetical protein